MVDVLEIDDGRSAKTFTLSDLASHPDLDALASDLEGERASAVPVSALMDLGIDGTWPWVTVTAADGYRASIPAGELLRGGRVLVSLPDRPSDVAGGGSFRLIVEDGPTLCWNVKHVVSMRAASVREPDSVPDNPSH